MINITNEKARLLPLYSEKYCGGINPSQCSKEVCECSLLAEYHAFKNLILPEGYRSFEIKDFTGDVGNGKSLDPVSAMKAKKKVVEYCYCDLSLEKLKKLSQVDLDKLSVIGSRLDEGRNVIIYGDSKKEIIKDESSTSVSQSPLGRTFVASLLTKEVIKLKLDSRYYKRYFDWVDFSELTNILKGKDEESRVQAQYYEDCDWLVIDDISEGIFGKSIAHKAFLQELFSSFFSYRHKNNLVSVVVFKFDIERKRKDLESIFGIPFIKVLEDKKTFFIGLN